MIRSSAAFLFALPVAVAFTAAPVLAQYAPPPPGAYYRERLPPAVGSYDDDEDLPPPPRNLRRGQQGVLPYPDDEPRCRRQVSTVRLIRDPTGTAGNLISSSRSNRRQCRARLLAA